MYKPRISLVFSRLHIVLGVSIVFLSPFLIGIQVAEAGYGEGSYYGQSSYYAQASYVTYSTTPGTFTNSNPQVSPRWYAYPSYDSCAGASYDSYATRALDGTGNYVYNLYLNWRGDYSGWFTATPATGITSSATIGGNYGRDTVYAQIIVDQNSYKRSGATVIISQCKGGLVLPPNSNYPWDGHAYYQETFAPIVPPAPATCSVTADTNPLAYGASTVLRWTSANAGTSFYINGIGYVTPNQSSSATVSPSATTAYNGTAIGPGGSTSCNFTLNVNPPVSCTWNGGSVAHGSSITAYQVASLPVGQSCSTVSQTRTCTNGVLSGSYQYASCVNNCSFNGTTVTNGSSVTAYQSATVPYGTSCVSQNRVCANGTLSGSYQYSSCSFTCTPQYSYTCPDLYTIAETATSSDCSVSVNNQYTSCASPTFCSVGSPTCINPSPVFTQGGSLSGHLQAVPLLISKGDTAKIFWNVSNVLSCTVSGSNGDLWSTNSSATLGNTTSPISTQTVFTLNCPLFPNGTSAISESLIINVIPKFQEK